MFTHKFLPCTKSKEEFNLSDLSIDCHIQNVDPRLWEAICQLTRSTKDPSKATPLSQHTKKVQRLTILCAIMYCINEDYTLPLHTLITDVIEGQGGSALLIKILNRLGLCSSDTLARHIQQKSTSHQNTISSCISDSFTIFSVDNIDFQLTHGRTYDGRKSSNSWHGTSVQAVQPLPSLTEQHADVEVMDIEVRGSELNRATSKRNREEMGASYSCSPASKKRKRPRTGTELPNVTEALNEVHTPLPQPSSGAQRRLHHSISDFLINHNEQLALDELKQE